MSAWRSNSNTERETVSRLFRKLAVLAALCLLGNSAFGQTACTTLGWAASNKIFPTADAACHYSDFSASNSTDSAVYKYIANGYESTTNVWCKLILSVTGTPAFCVGGNECGVFDRGNQFVVGQITAPCPNYFLVVILNPNCKTCNKVGGDPINPA